MPLYQYYPDNRWYEMSDKTILVLGGGVGGLVASNVLKDKLRDQITVRLVERKRQLQFPPSPPHSYLTSGKGGCDYQLTCIR